MSDGDVAQEWCSGFCSLSYVGVRCVDRVRQVYTYAFHGETIGLLLPVMRRTCIFVCFELLSPKSVIIAVLPDCFKERPQSQTPGSLFSSFGSFSKSTSRSSGLSRRI